MRCKSSGSQAESIDFRGPKSLTRAKNSCSHSFGKVRRQEYLNASSFFAHELSENASQCLLSCRCLCISTPWVSLFITACTRSLSGCGINVSIYFPWASISSTYLHLKIDLHHNTTFHLLSIRPSPKSFSSDSLQSLH